MTTMPKKRRMIVFVVSNQKGGVGKTTTAVHKTFDFARKTVIDYDTGEERDARVAYISSEIQRNGIKTLEKNFGLANVNASVFYSPDEFEIVVNGPVTVYAGGPFMADIDRNQGRHFKDQIDRISPYFDYCVIDTPPSAGVLQVAPLTAADYVLCPLELEDFSMEGVVDMLKTILGIKQRYNPGLNFLGILPCRVLNTSLRQKKALESLLTRYPQYVFAAADAPKMSVRQAIPEALSEGVPVWDLKKSSAREAADEMLHIMALLDQKMGV